MERAPGRRYGAVAGRGRPDDRRRADGARRRAQGRVGLAGGLVPRHERHRGGRGDPRPVPRRLRRDGVRGALAARDPGARVHGDHDGAARRRPAPAAEVPHPAHAAEHEELARARRLGPDRVQHADERDPRRALARLRQRGEVLALVQRRVRSGGGGLHRVPVPPVRRARLVARAQPAPPPARAGLAVRRRDAVAVRAGHGRSRAGVRDRRDAACAVHARGAEVEARDGQRAASGRIPAERAHGQRPEAVRGGNDARRRAARAAHRSLAVRRRGRQAGPGDGRRRRRDLRALLLQVRLRPRGAIAAALMTPKQPLEMSVTPLASFPPPSQWDDWMEYDAQAWPKRVERRYTLVPTTCFNCEAACGLVAYVDKSTWKIQKLEGNPHHPGSRGRNCAKGPATKNQIEDPQRILYPLKRVGPRGGGNFERVSWDEVLDTFAAKIRAALLEGRKTEVMYHVGRPGHDGYMDRVLQSWGVDGHNSHTNVCSAAARLGYALWCGADRPSPDHEHSKMMLLLSSHLETGHYFNPHAQRIIDAKMAGAKLAVVDVRPSHTASLADFWIAPWPGTESFLLLAMASVILREKLYDAPFLEQWTNWREFMAALAPDEPREFARFLALLERTYAKYTTEAAEQECGVAQETIVEVAREIGKAGSAFASHVWR